MEASLVIKVKYGDMLRRFNARVYGNHHLDLDIKGLRARICSLFSFPRDLGFTLSYVDEDGDIIALVDDEDLCDVMKQQLKFLKIYVQVKNNRNGISATPGGSSTHLRSPVAQQSEATEVPNSFPVTEQICQALSKMAIDLAAKAASTSPAVKELTESSLKTANLNTDAGPGPGPKSHSSSAMDSTQDTSEATVSSKESNFRGNQEAEVNGLAASSSSGLARAVKSNTPSISNSLGDYFSECPFSGMQLEPYPKSVVPPASPPCFQHEQQVKGNPDNNDTVDIVFHRGVRCDVCGVHPIIGPRHKSKWREDFDLCRICFSLIGSEADFIKLDHPLPYQLSVVKEARASSPQNSSCLASGSKLQLKLDNCFVLDVNVVDGKVLAPGTPFTKIWRLRNSGRFPWHQGFQLVFMAGDKMGVADSVEIKLPVTGVPTEGEVDVSVDFLAPASPGYHVSYWMMASPAGQKFGQLLWVLIQVDGPLKDHSNLSDNFKHLNSNFPPSRTCSSGPEVLDLNVPLVTEDGLLNTCNADPVMEIEGQLRQNWDLNFPPEYNFFQDHDNLGPGLVVDYPATVEGSAVNQFPAPSATGVAPHSPVGSSMYSEDVGDNNTTEQTLPEELDAMSREQVSEDIFVMDQHNLKQSVDELSSVIRWEELTLKVLTEMGYTDKENNRRLLRKNNGDLSLVFSDLLSTEEATL